MGVYFPGFAVQFFGYCLPTDFQLKLITHYSNVRPYCKVQDGIAILVHLTINIFSKQHYNKVISKAQAALDRQKIDDNRTHNLSYYGDYFLKHESQGTAHLSVLAENGDAVSATNTVNYGYVLKEDIFSLCTYFSPSFYEVYRSNGILSFPL